MYYVMRIVRLLLILELCIVLDGRFIFYYTDHRPNSFATFDCIYAYLEEDHRDVAGPFTRSSYLIPYCRRPDTNEIEDDTINSKTIMSQMLSFNDLKKEGITSAQLLDWMAPIDIAERYENYNGYTDEIFYNCSLPWFGTKCQYRFDFNTSHSFADIVNVIFSGRLKLCRKIENETCYPFLPSCYRGPSPICLDWREICDGKYDCLNGEDEHLCEELELNECADEEYRCHYGGQCIPFGFVDDGRKNIDCLDASDEMDATILHDTVLVRLGCHTIPTFVCEERICRYPHSFSCGDGDCILFYRPDVTSKLCFNRRRIEITRLLLTTKDPILDETCQNTLLCLLRISNNASDTCFTTTTSTSFNISRCKSLNTHCSSKWIAIPSQPILFGFFQFIYLTNRSNSEFEQNILPDFVCFDPKRCPGLLSTIVNIEFSHGLVCSHISDLLTVQKEKQMDRVERIFKDIVRRCLTIGTELSCSNPSLFHCSLSLKCVSYHRVVDGFNDCYHGEDESYLACQRNDSSRFICPFNSSMCLSPIAVGNLITDCPYEEDELTSRERPYLQRPPFPYFCNKKEESVFYYADSIDEENCELWPCNTPYVRCDKSWNCLNGIDELNCPDSKCSINEHECSLKSRPSTICLSMEHLYDRYLDNCSFPVSLHRQIYFDNRTQLNISEYISWNKTKCITVNQLCPPHLSTLDTENNVCLYQKYRGSITDRIEGLPSMNMTEACLPGETQAMTYASPYATTLDMGFLPPTFVTLTLQNNQTDPEILPTIDILHSWYCNRGILIRHRSNDNPPKTTELDRCLCPPSYFGSRCQWQNQRISLTLKLVTHSVTSVNIVFQVIIVLIDQNGLIMPYHEQITFVPIRDCSTKFNIYLLYPDRPKNLSAVYSIRIDIYHKITLDYYGSWYLSIPYSFLPVNRIATQLFITDMHEMTSCPLLCGQHGRCQSYQNNKTFYFCQCHSGYSGVLCNIKHECHCSNDSLCISPSICVCPLDKFGPRCYLKNFICESLNNPCKHNGICIPNDDRISHQRFTCICTEGYAGDTCENNNNRINIQFDETLIKTVSSIHIHLITIFKDKHHERITIFKKIPFDSNTITFYIQQPFHILLTELTNKTYYLTIVRETYIKSENISTQVQSNQRCKAIEELLNSTLLNSNSYQRIKYYPYLCRQYKHVMCFYDETYICLCDINRFSNCIDFNHTMTYDCQGQNDCQNNGRCLVNNATCPTMSICICEECYYGRKCQFTTKGFILSLDSILGYQIKPNVPISRQPSIVKWSIGIIIFMYIFGLISGLLSILTFQTKQPREVGCGWYLLTSSIVSICTLTILQIKFWILLLSQRGFLIHRRFLSFSCITTDPTMKILLASYEWLNVCVMIERMFAAKLGVKFNKSRSKKKGKRIIFIIPLLIILTYIYDPFHYGLVDDIDIDEKRTWCYVHYSKPLRIYNTIINLLHFIVPFSINIISSIFLLSSTARSRARVQPQITYMQHLQQEVKQDKYILFPPCVLVLLNLPRLIIMFMSGCMISPRNPSLFVIGYFLSFVPMTIHFFLFVWPSKQYMKHFKAAIQQRIRRFH